MRGTLTLLGLGFIILMVGAVYAFNHGFTKRVDTQATINNSTIPMASTLTLTSSAFGNGGEIPATYTCDDTRDQNPPLAISGVPEGTKSLALIMDDPDVPKALKPDGVFVHWVLFNIPPPARPGETRDIPAGGTVGVAGANGAGKNAYTGPCPPPQYEPSEHRYFFKLYALDRELGLTAGASKADVLGAMGGHIIGEAELVGRYKRK